MFGRLTKLQRIRRRIEDVLVGFGYSEAYTWSLLAGDPTPGGVHLQEPLSSEQAVLRTSLVEGMLASARRNVDAGNDEIALFELAHVYLPPANSCPRNTGTSAGSRKAGSRSPRGRSRASTRPSASSRSSVRPTSCPRRPRRPDTEKAGSHRCAIPIYPASGARSSSTWMHS